MLAPLRLKLAFALSLATFAPLPAQDCAIPFTTPLFGVRSEMDIPYGTAQRYNGAQEVLRLNLFKPVGDGQTERPLIILIHGGGFFDGDRNDLNAQCMELASMGWAAATISYRLDFYGTWLLGSPFAYDPAEVIRAAYRAQQDARGALRFLKARHLADSTSTTNVMYLGYSAGAITALHAAYVDEPSEKPAACNAIGNVQHFLSSYPRPDLGPIEGTLNLNGYSDEVLGVASMYGGLLDTNFVSGPLDPALYSYHQTGDPVVGCGYQRGLWGMPLGVGDNYPFLYGSCMIDTRVQNLDPEAGRYLYHEHNGSGHEVHDLGTVLPEAYTFLRDLFCPQGVKLAARAILEGPYDPATGLMHDPLRSLGSFPLMDPYPALGYVHTESGDGGTISPTVLSTTGPNAIVDWVVVELRDANTPTNVLATQSALLQRDGDIVATDGLSPLTFDRPAGLHHVAVRHHNHLGVMTGNATFLGASPTLIDLSSAGTTTFGTNARRSIEGAFPAEVLWAGDVNFDGIIKYTGEANDRDPILQTIGGDVPTATVSGYHGSDVNMDGTVKYTGVDNDRDPILQNIGGGVPTGIRVEQVP